MKNNFKANLITHLVKRWVIFYNTYSVPLENA